MRSFEERDPLREHWPFAVCSRTSQFLPDRLIAKLDSLPPLSDYLVKPCGVAAMDLGEWLKGLGLGQYEATFREHEIDADVLPDLTEADLEKIGLHSAPANV
jgi:hypothetical protein